MADKLLVGTNSFDTIFRDFLRNYYVYGFKTFSDTNKSEKTVHKHNNIVKKILKDEWKYQKHGKRVHFMTYDKSWQTSNPLNKFYAFHTSNKFTYYFPVLLELSLNTEYNHVYPEPLFNEKDNDGEITTDNDGRFIADKWTTDLLMEYARNSDTQIKIRSVANLLEIPLGSQFIEIRTFNYKKNELAELGIIHQATDEEFQQLLNDQQTELITHKKRDDKDLWVLSDTIDSLYQTLDDHDIHDLNEMIQFFSQYEILGSIGNRLLNRIHLKANDAIHFKNNYIMETLYDYNLISLLIAIENHAYCLIEYTHGTSNITSEHFIYPLEIRISVKNGREHLIYYDMLRNMLTSMRLDFIDSIVLYDSSQSVQLKETIKSKEKSYKFDKPPYIPDDMLHYIWGVDTNLLVLDPEKKDYKMNLTTVRIKYKNDDFVNQIRKECRHGQMNYQNHTMSIDVLSALEMHPWIRSLYPHIKDYQEITHDFVYRDISEMNDAYNKHKPLDLKVTNNSIEIVSGQEISSYKHTDAIFNELFSYRNIIIADSYLEYASQEEKDYNEENLKEIILNNIKKYQDYISLEYEDKTGNLTEEACKILSEDIYSKLSDEMKLFDNNAFKPLYTSRKKRYLDILPLTTLELRWLKTMINEPVSKLFINNDIRTTLNQYLDSRQIQPFDIREYIKYYDCENYNRLKSDNYPSQNYIHQFRTLYDMLDNNDIHKVKISLSSGEILEGYPGWLEFSKLKDTFNLVVYEDRQDIRLFIEISRIKEIVKLESVKAKEDIQNNIKKKECQISLSFDDVRNVPDRILNEFAPWKKECIYNKDTHPSYTLTLYYDKSDEEDIIRRILSYGPYLKINDENNSVYKRIKEIIKEQKENFLTQTETRTI